MGIIGNFLQAALSSLKTDRDVPVGVSNPGDDRGALHTMLKGQGETSANPLFVNTVNSSGGSGGVEQLLEKIPVTINNLNVNQWVPITTTLINRIADVIAFDQSDYEELIIEWRITNSGTTFDIKSKIQTTLTIHVEGYAT